MRQKAITMATSSGKARTTSMYEHSVSQGTGARDEIEVIDSTRPTRSASQGDDTQLDRVGGIFEQDVVDLASARR